VTSNISTRRKPNIREAFGRLDVLANLNAQLRAEHGGGSWAPWPGIIVI
jgi:hypothetical protein